MGILFHRLQIQHSGQILLPEHGVITQMILQLMALYMANYIIGMPSMTQGV